MRLGLSSVLFSSAPVAERTPEVVARRCRELGFTAVELRPDYLQEQNVAPGAVRQILRSQGLDLVYATGTQLVDCPYQPADPHNPLRLDFSVASMLGADILRIFPGDLARRGASSSTAARAWGAFAVAEGRRLVLENPGSGPGSDPVELGRFVREIGVGMGLNFDVGNAAQAGLEPAATLAKVLRVTAMLHLKDFAPGDSRGANIPLGAGVVDFAAVARVLVDWSGTAFLEVDAGAQLWTTLESWERWLRAVGF